MINIEFYSSKFDTQIYPFNVETFREFCLIGQCFKWESLEIAISLMGQKFHIIATRWQHLLNKKLPNCMVSFVCFSKIISITSSVVKNVLPSFDYIGFLDLNGSETIELSCLSFLK